MTPLIADYDLRCAVRDALAYLEDLMAYGEISVSGCDEHGKCNGCAEAAQLEYVIGQLKRGLAKETK